LFVAVLLVAMPPAARGQTPRGKGDDGPPRTLTVTGTGTVKTVADTARVNFFVRARGDTAALGHDALKTKVRKFNEELAGLKIAGLTVQAGPVEVTEAESVGNAMAPDGTPAPPRKVVYVGRTFRVTLKRGAKENGIGPLMKQVDRVVLAAARGGASFGSGDDLGDTSPEPFLMLTGRLPGGTDEHPVGRAVFVNTREEEQQREALDLAVANALAKARRLAGKSGWKIVRVTEVREQPGGFAADAGLRRPAYDPVTGEREIVVGVTVTCSYVREE
jgi:uncharacterized protein YggE